MVFGVLPFTNTPNTISLIKPRVNLPSYAEMAPGLFFIATGILISPVANSNSTQRIWSLPCEIILTTKKLSHETPFIKTGFTNLQVFFNTKDIRHVLPVDPYRKSQCPIELERKLFYTPNG